MSSGGARGAPVGSSSDGTGGTGRGGSASRGAATTAKSHRALNYGTVHGDLYTKPKDLDKKGTSGIPVNCATNFVRILDFPEGYQFYQFHCVFRPEVDSKKERFALMSQLKETLGEHYLFDGQILYLNRDIGTRAEELTAKHTITGEPIRVELQQSVRFSHNDPQAINIYNILIRTCMEKVGFTQLARNFYNSDSAVEVKQYHVRVWPGYETAIRLYEDHLMLCVENRFKVLNSKTVLSGINDEMQSTRGQYGGGDQATAIGRCRANVDRMFIGQTVMTMYNNRMYRVTSFDWDKSPLSEFEHKSTGKKMTYRQYFKEQHNVDIGTDVQPLIVSHGKPKQPGEAPQVTYLVPELCHLTGLSDQLRKDNRVMKVLSEHTRLNPERRKNSTMELIRRLAENDEARNILESWNLKLDSQMVSMQARVLPPEKLMGNQREFTVNAKKAEWAMNCKSHGSYSVKALGNWVIVLPNHPDMFNLGNKFLQETKTLGNVLKMPVNEPLVQGVNGGADANDYLAAIRAIFEQYPGIQIDMVVAILPDDNKTRYDSIKKQLCLDSPVPSQCVLRSTLAGKAADRGENKNLSSIVLKVLLQMNCKMGGALWKVNIPVKNAMIVGYDLYHDSTMKGKTVGACVSSYDADYTQWYSQTRPHSNPNQLGENLFHFLKKGLRKYYLANGETLPEKVFIYRDGCGDGQIPYIRNEEVQHVKRALEDVCRAKPGHQIQFSFTIVTKKVNMRIFKKAGDLLVNPDPGTVVDSVVTRPERWDYYMVPQAVNQGTVTPVCYNVIYDDTGMTPDRHQRLSFKLCHMYYNWQGTVRVPAPCQYAHKLAFLVAQSLTQGGHENLRDKLYFL